MTWWRPLPRLATWPARLRLARALWAVAAHPTLPAVVRVLAVHAPAANPVFTAAHEALRRYPPRPGENGPQRRAREVEQIAHALAWARQHGHALDPADLRYLLSVFADTGDVGGVGGVL
jgi:hypothetical protein